MTETVMAIIVIDGEVRLTCCGCTELLERVGLVRRVWSRPLNQLQPEFVITHYEIAPDATLADCQGVVRDRHIGNHGEMWGEPISLTDAVNLIIEQRDDDELPQLRDGLRQLAKMLNDAIGEQAKTIESNEGGANVDQ